MSSLYTIGYEELTLQQFIEKLKENCIQMVVDVRELPLSRKPGFSKTKLSEALEEAGIQYESIRALGSPRELRQEFRETKDWPSFSYHFLAHLQDQTDVLERLVSQTYNKTICLLCFERDSAICHRSIVARKAIEIANNDLEVRNL